MTCRPYLLSLLLLCGCAGAAPAPGSSAAQEVTVPNQFPNEPACAARLPPAKFACTASGCTIPAPAKNSLKAIELTFSCIPKSSPTEFDKPADDMKVLSLRARNAQGNLGLIDQIDGAPEELMRELSFCLYGKTANLCGAAKTQRLKDGAKADPTKAIKAFIEGIELQ
ncbi:MAG TPA: hypothetical protein VGD52_04145 [Pseudoduganella sp.]